MTTPWGAALLASLLPLAGVGLVAPPAAAASGRCAEGSGVTVVVDFGPLGGGTRVGCAPGGADQPGSQVVPAAGFPMTYVSGAPFVCRISGLPDADEEDCSGTPPADAYWGLFWSDGDPATWTYATVGITGLEVPEGGSIGWRWQDGGGRDLPGAAPNADPPTDEPSEEPSDEPSDEPGDEPSGEPGDEPSGPDGQGNGQGNGPGNGPSPDPGGSAGSGPAAGPAATPTPSAPAASPSRGGPSAGAATGSDAAPRRGPAHRTAEERERGDRDRQAAAVSSGQDGAGDEDGGVTRALEPASGEATPGGSSALAPWLAGVVLLALGAGAVVLGRRRRTGG